MRIVIVDDVRQQAASLSRAVRNELERNLVNLETVTLSSVQEVKNFEWGDDIYIIDEHLFDGFNPDTEDAPLSGNNLGKAIVKNHPNAKVIIYTGDSEGKKSEFPKILKTDREALLKKLMSFVNKQ